MQAPAGMPAHPAPAPAVRPNLEAPPVRIAFDPPAPTVAEIAAAEAADPIARELLAAALADLPGNGALHGKARDLLARVLLLQWKLADAAEQWERAAQAALAADLPTDSVRYQARATRCREFLAGTGMPAHPAVQPQP